jgi:hypothetical protein
MPGFLNSLSEIMGNISGKLYGALNRILPPEQRTAMLSRLQQFAINNPKLAVRIHGSLCTLTLN